MCRSRYLQVVRNPCRTGLLFKNKESAPDQKVGALFSIPISDSILNQSITQVGQKRRMNPLAVIMIGHFDRLSDPILSQNTLKPDKAPRGDDVPFDAAETVRPDSSADAAELVTGFFSNEMSTGITASALPIGLP